MSKSNKIWNEQRIGDHTKQFRATVMVIAHLAKYSSYANHKKTILEILKKRNY